MFFGNPLPFFQTLHWDQHLRHSQGFFTTGLVTSDNGYPSLSCKAYNGRVWLVFMVTCLHSAVLTTNNPEMRLAYSTCKALSVYFDRLERCPRYLNDAQARSQYDSMMQFVSGYHKLATLSLSLGQSRWKLIPKLHCCVHLAENALRDKYNPKYYHCFKDEDFMGLLKKLGCMVAKPLMEFRVLLRWQLRLASWSPGTGVWGLWI